MGIAKRKTKEAAMLLVINLQGEKNMLGRVVASGFSVILIFVLYIGLLGLSIYLMIQLIKLTQRGIKALDLYFDEKSSNRM